MAQGSVLAESPFPRWLRRSVTACGVVYLLSIWLDAGGSTLPGAVLPSSLRFFTQVAELFPKASLDAIAWRARAWRCREGDFEELDVRPLFPIRRDDKENQFSRAMHFYFRDRAVLQALDEYVTNAENRIHPEYRIGGVMLLSLRIPIPPLGEPGPRETWQPMDAYPPSVSRKTWYAPSSALRTRRCEDDP